MNKIILPIVFILMFLGIALLFTGIYTGNEIFWFKWALLPPIAGVILVYFLNPERPSMKITKIPTVSIEQILADCPLVNEQFNEADFNVSFGDAVATLVDKEMFLDMLEEAGLDYGENGINAMLTPIDFEMDKIYKRLDDLADSTLINLES